MRYLGGKTQISKYLATEIRKITGKPFLDPFCGSLAMSISFAGNGIASDISAPLVNMYQAIYNGWEPPIELSRDQWELCKSLPDEDPMKGFAGFACSFRGLYFSGYAGGYVGPVSRHGAIAAHDVLIRDIGKLKSAGVSIVRRDFFDIEPTEDFFLYADPPYLGTTGYSSVGEFDHRRFYARLSDWSKVTDVFVSEYDLPIGNCIWSKERKLKLSVTGESRTEKLFHVKDQET